MSRLSTLPRRALASLLATVLIVMLVPLPAAAFNTVVARPDGTGEVAELAMVTDPVPLYAAEFGESVAVRGRWAVASVRTLSPPARAFRWVPHLGWTAAGDLPLSGGDGTGHAVAVSADQMFAGAPYRVANGPTKLSGVVYVCDATDTGITLEQTLSVNATDTTGWFGWAIAIDGNTMAVGAPAATVGALNCGSVFVFGKGPAGWVQTQRIDPPAPQQLQLFGFSVALQGEDLVVGSNQYGPIGEGRVYTYRRGPGGVWVASGDQGLTPPLANDQFGYSVAVFDGVMVAGAIGRDTSTGVEAGAASIFAWSGSGWTRIADLESPSPRVQERFGNAVALSADTLLVSAYNGVGSEGATSGVVYRYTLDPLRVLPPTYQGVVRATDPGSFPDGDMFGYGLGFDGDTLMVGGPAYSNETTTRMGAAWLYGGMRSARVRVDRTLAVPMPGLLGNDLTTVGTMTASLLATPTHGIATVNEDGSWGYDPTSWFLGTDTFWYRTTSDAGTADATVTVQVYPPATKVATSITIKRTPRSVRKNHKVKLYGRLNPGALGDHCVVYVKKPGSHSWRKLSTRHASSITPNVGANWSYSLKPKVRGRYYFKVRFPGDTYRYADWSPVVSVRVR